jgi:hypothetical protein
MPITVSVIQLGDVVDDGAEARRLFGQGGLLAVTVGLGGGLSFRDDAGERLVQARSFDFFEYPVAVGIFILLGVVISTAGSRMLRSSLLCRPGYLARCITLCPPRGTSSPLPLSSS